MPLRDVATVKTIAISSLIVGSFIAYPLLTRYNQSFPHKSSSHKNAPQLMEQGNIELPNVMPQNQTLGNPNSAPAPAPAAAGPGAILASQLGHELSNLARENDIREGFTQKFVEKFDQNYYVVLSHNGGEVTGDDYSHEHVELPIAFGHTIGFEVYYSPKGKPFKFVRKGDGGFINWAYSKDLKRVDDYTVTAQ